MNNGVRTSLRLWVLRPENKNKLEEKKQWRKKKKYTPNKIKIRQLVPGEERSEEDLELFFFQKTSLVNPLPNPGLLGLDVRNAGSIPHQSRRKDPLKEEMAWIILWTEEPDGLQSTGLLRVGHD